MEQASADEDASSPARNEAADSRATGEAASSDSEWSGTDDYPVPSIVDDEDYETPEQASRLIRDDPCEKKCLKGKETELGNFLQSVSGMERSVRVTIIMAVLVVLIQTDTIMYHRGNGVRNKFHYFLPLVGKVCDLSFCASYGITLVTVQLHKGQILGGTFAAKPHGNKKNKNASVIDIRWLIDWFTEFAKEVGDVVPSTHEEDCRRDCSQVLQLGAVHIIAGLFYVGPVV
ncbi:hypothetical protein PC117_g11548 [Phytophthora cactorum]|uniref:Uncharacterized protein n=1 Tax=Phytophthora cactorum TaxID=29920 RepID=A0A8T1DCZ9_9STRA|nr:hypothetical protein PC117_g11548 [Phytophthora cactorum]